MQLLWDLEILSLFQMKGLIRAAFLCCVGMGLDIQCVVAV